MNASMNSTQSTALPNESAGVNQTTEKDLAFFNQLVLAYQDAAYHQAFSILGDHALAEDVTQDSFLKAYQKFGQFRGGSFRAWLLRIVVNTAYDFLRLSKRQPTTPLFPVSDQDDELDTPFWLADPGPSVETFVERGELIAHLQQLLADLPENYRSILSLVDVHDLDYKEAAAVLNVPIGTVKSRLARARFQMQEKMKGYPMEALLS